MSLYNTRYPNQINTRVNECYSEQLFTVDPEAGLMARVLPGGGTPGPVDLPYWVKPQSANIYDNASRDETVHNKLGYFVQNAANAKNATLTKDGVEVNTTSTGTGSELTSTSLNFGDAGGNYAINKIGCKNLAELGSRIDKAAPVAADKMLIYDTSGGMYKTTPWLDYLKPTSIITAGTTMASSIDSTGIKTAATGVGNICTIGSSLIHMGSKTSASNPAIDNNRGICPNQTYSSFELSTRMNGFNATITYNSGTISLISQSDERRLTFNNLDDLVNLYAKTTITTPTSEEKMLLYNPTSKAYRYTNLPAGNVAPRVLKWVPVLSSNQSTLYDNKGLIGGTLSYSNRTSTSAKPYNVLSTPMYCPIIGDETTSLRVGDTFHIAFLDTIDAVNRFGFTLTTASPLAILPFKIFGGSYAPLVSFPMFSVLYDVDADVQVSVEPGSYVFKDVGGDINVSCNLLFFRYRGTTSRAVIPSVALKYELATLAGSIPISEHFA